MVPWVEELFAGAGSDVALDTVAVFDRLPPADVDATIVTVAAPEAASEPRLHVTVPVAKEHDPCVAFADTNDRPAGKGSDATTASALDGPALATAKV